MKLFAGENFSKLKAISWYKNTELLALDEMKQTGKCISLTSVSVSVGSFGNGNNLTSCIRISRALANSSPSV